MKVIMLTKYYPQYLEYFYNKHPESSGLPFQEHRQMIFDDHFSWPADLSLYMNTQGIETHFVIANAEALQKKWVKENNFKNYSYSGWEKEIVLKQIMDFKPDVLWIDAIFDYFGDFIKSALHYCKKVVVWVSCATPANLDVTGISVLITSQPDILEDKQHLFDKVVITYPGFNHTILNKLENVEKVHDLVFIGLVSPDHQRRAQVLAYLIENGIDIKIFGIFSGMRSFGVVNTIRQVAGHILKRRDIPEGIQFFRNGLLKSVYQKNLETIKTAYQGSLFGLDYYRALAAARIGINIHSDVSGDHSDNMRMFETTGVGTCLLTNDSPTNGIIFQPEKEILTFKSEEHLLDILKNINFNSQKIQDIADAGQQKTLKDHSIERMFEDIREVFE